MKFHWKKTSILLALFFALGVSNLWAIGIYGNCFVNAKFSDTLPPVEKPIEKTPFKNKFQYDKDGKITHIETEDYNIKLEYDSRCNKQSKSTRIKKETGDSIVYTFTYDASCQLSKGESTDRIKLGFKFDSQQRLIAIIEGARKINITYNDSGLPGKISLGNRDYVDKLYDSSGNVIAPRSNSWWRAPVGTYRVLKIMYQIIKDAETLFNRLIKFKPGLNMSQISFIFSQYADRPPFIDWDM